jgi:TRAP-type C4-dicarboxylate transport system permease small subunit
MGASISETPTETPTPTSHAPKWLLAVDRVLDRVSAGISHVCTVVLVVMLLTMVVAATIQVIARYVFPTVVGGPEEIARTAMVAIVFLGLPVLARHAEHIVLDMLQEKVRSARGREYLLRVGLAAELLFLTILAVLAYTFIERLWLSPQESPALEIRLFWTRLPVLVGAVLAAVVTAAALLRRFLLTGATVYGRSTAEPMGVETLAGRELAPEVGEPR